MQEPPLADLTHRDTQQLARVAPEIRVVVYPGEELIIEAITPQAASWVGAAPDTLRGRAFTMVFGDMIPALSDVVDQVLNADLAVRDYRVAFTDQSGSDRSVVIQAARERRQTDDAGVQINIRFDELWARPDPPLAERPLTMDGFIGRSSAMQAVFRKITLYGPTAAPVVITGETGTGKELAARALHTHSPRRRHPFVAVNCAALSEELLETELFGHERGAFTSAVRAHRGRFERAHTGTLFLDEIGELPLRLQAKLLRVLEEGVIERVGGDREVNVDVRLISATNVSLEQAVQARTFRLDLYHRLDVLRVHMPPLRERAEDIPLLATHFLDQLNMTYQRQVQGLTPDAILFLQTYHWPGNIREIRNVLERVVVETGGEVIGRRAFDEWVRERSHFSPGTWNVSARETERAARPTIITPYPSEIPTTPRLASPVHDMESVTNGVWRLSGQANVPSSSWQEPIDVTSHEVVQPVTPERLGWAYQQADGNITQAARRLGMHKTTFYRHMKTLGLTREALEKSEINTRSPFSSEGRAAGEAHDE